MTCSSTNGAWTTTDAATSRTNLGIGAAATLPTPVSVPNGGTGLSSIISSRLLVGNGIGALTQFSASAGAGSHNLLIAATAGNPAWAAPTTTDTTLTVTGSSSAITIGGATASSSQRGVAGMASNSTTNTGTSTTTGVVPAGYVSRLLNAGNTVGATTPADATVTHTSHVSNLSQINSGSGAPSASMPTVGCMYMRTDGSSTTTRAYISINTSGTYTNFVTVA